mgnify:CR=1 FL=1
MARASPGGRRLGSPTLEILAIDLTGAYRFPIAEALAFLYAFFPFLSRLLGLPLPAGAEEGVLLQVMSATQTFLGLITLILILRNISWGLANEVKKGLIQTYLTYPIGRGRLLLVKFISGVLVPVAYVALSILLFTGLNTPGLAARYPHVLALGLLAMLGDILFTASFLFLTAVLVKSAGTSLGVGIITIFGVQIVESVLMVLGILFESAACLQAAFVLSPFMALTLHYSPGFLGPGLALFVPGFWDCVGYLAANLSITTGIYVTAFVYFMRGFEPA